MLRLSAMCKHDSELRLRWSDVSAIIMRYKNIRIHTEVERVNDTVLEGNDYFAILQVSLKKR